MKKNAYLGGCVVLSVLGVLWLLKWVISKVIECLDYIQALFPDEFIASLGLPDILVKIILLLLIYVILWVVGFISNQPYVKRVYQNWLAPKILKVPILGIIWGFIHQIVNVLETIAKAKEVVLVETFEKGYEVGFVTSESPDKISDAIKEEDSVSVLLAFSPLTSFRVVAKSRRLLIKTEFSVSEAIFYLLAFGVKGKNKIISETIKEQSHSDSEWDFFYCFFCL